MDQFAPSLIATDAAERERFLEALEATGSISGACRATGTTRSTAYRVKRDDPEFGAAWDRVQRSRARDAGTDALEAAMLARATHGVERYRFGRDEVTIWVEHDNRLAMFLLAKRKPRDYGDGPPAAVPVRTMTRAEFIAAIEARPRTVDLSDE